MIKDATSLCIMVLSQNPFLTEQSFLSERLWTVDQTPIDGEASAHRRTRVIGGTKIDLTFAFNAKHQIVRVEYGVTCPNEASAYSICDLLAPSVQKHCRCPAGTKFRRQHWGDCHLHRLTWKYRPHARIELEIVQPVSRRPGRTFAFRHIFLQPMASARSACLDGLFVE